MNKWVVEECLILVNRRMREMEAMPTPKGEDACVEYAQLQSLKKELAAIAGGR